MKSSLSSSTSSSSRKLSTPMGLILISFHHTFGNELSNLINQHRTLRNFRKQIKSMNHIRKFNQIHFLPTVLQPFIIPSLPILQRIESPYEHNRRRKFLQFRNLLRIRPTNVRRWMVSIRSFRQERLPKPIRSRHRNDVSWI